MKRWICLVGILISLILMLLPEGVAMTFASGPGETIKCFYPFFSRIPLGYGNLFPAASILLSAIGAAFLLFAPRVRPAILTCLGMSILANAASWMLFASFTAVSLGIVLFQAGRHSRRSAQRLRQGPVSYTHLVPQPRQHRLQPPGLHAAQNDQPRQEEPHHDCLLYTSRCV